MTAPTTHLHQVPGGALAYAWSNGPVQHPLVMLHGLGDSAIITFADMVARGSLGTIPTLLIDLPGFGQSTYTLDHPATLDRYANDIADLLTTLAIRPTAVFGHSMGGNVAIYLAGQHPTLVNRLIVAEPLLDREQSVLASGIVRFDEATFVARRFPMLVRATSFQAHRQDVAAAAFLTPLRRAHPTAMHRAASSLVECAHMSLKRLLAATSLPRTLILGERTLAVTSELDSAGIRIVRIANAGHFMLIEQEKSSTYAILNAMT